MVSPAGYGAYRARADAKLKRKEFIEAAQVGGVSTASIVLRHIVPNVLGVVVYASLLVPSMILFESFLSFPGLGTQEPLSSWGIAQRWRQLNGSFAHYCCSRRVSGGDPVLFQLYRRWSA